MRKSAHSIIGCGSHITGRNIGSGFGLQPTTSNNRNILPVMKDSNILSHSAHATPFDAGTAKRIHLRRATHADAQCKGRAQSESCANANDYTRCLPSIGKAERAPHCQDQTSRCPLGHKTSSFNTARKHLHIGKRVKARRGWQWVIHRETRNEDGRRGISRVREPEELIDQLRGQPPHCVGKRGIDSVYRLKR